MLARAAPFTVVVCTRDRSDKLHPTLERLWAEQDRGPPFEVVVVDQSGAADPRLAARAAPPRLTVVRDDGVGVSRARNLGTRRATTGWVVHMDDDCLVAPGWAAELLTAIERHPEAACVSPNVDALERNACDGLEVTTFRVDREHVRRAGWPFEIGFGVCMAIRRDWIERIGGWDERLGPGNPVFPAAEDMDFNYRLLRAGALAAVVPRPRVLHDQWRACDELPRLFLAYATGWAGFACKTLATGDRRGGLRLWVYGLYGAIKMVLSALRRRSRLRLRVAASLLRGHALGTARGLATRW
jgi:GT2 family glycosyltransferase